MITIRLKNSNEQRQRRCVPEVEKTIIGQWSARDALASFSREGVDVMQFGLRKA